MGAASAQEAASSAAATRGSAGRFSQKAGQHEALDAAARIVTAAAGPGEDPRGVTKARYDAQRKAMGNPGLTSSGLRRRFGKLSFRAILEIALADVEDRGFAAPKGQTPAFLPGFPEAMMWRCLRAAAHHLGRTPTPSMYDRWAGEFIDERERIGAPPCDVPRSGTLVERAGSWDAALIKAELDPETAPGKSKNAVPDVVDVLERYLEENGCLPPTLHFEKWCEALDLSYSRRAPGGGRRDWSEIRDALRARRAASGRWTPGEVTPVRQCPPLPEAAGPRTQRVRRRKKVTEEMCLESLRIYGAEYLPAGRQATQDDYRGCAAGDPRLVSPSCLSNFGRFQDLCRKAGV